MRLTQTIEPTITVELLQELSAKLETYAILKAQLEEETAQIRAFCAENGITKAKTDAGSVSEVPEGSSTKLHKDKLIAQGVTLAQIAAATVEGKRAGYFQIRLAKESSHSGDPSAEE